MDAQENYAPLLTFDTDDALFARGFEAGRLWALVRSQPDEEIEEYVSTDNVEMVLRIAEATGRTAQSEELGDDWLLVKFGVAEDAASSET